MPTSQQFRPTARRARSTIAVVLALSVAAIIGAVLGYRVVAATSGSAASPVVSMSGNDQGAALPAPDLHQLPVGTGPAGLTIDDGVVHHGVTVFDGDVPAVANLDPDLLRALRQAATEASDDGVAFSVTSGWRSPAYQEQLLQEAIGEYGSEEEAARWVATAETSLHVTGDAVDIGPDQATEWLSDHGAAYGLCQTYRNEPWHFELRPGAVGDGCPRPYADPTQDPRMQR
jgi:zinc D-Ala-D-Ala carboxypeptidase